MVRTKQAEQIVQIVWVYRYRHSASIPPDKGIVIQEIVPRRRGSFSGGPGFHFMVNTWKSEWMNNAFSGVVSNNYWSSTTNAGNTDNAWNVNLNNGNVNNDSKTSNTNYVWPVRGGA